MSIYWGVNMVQKNTMIANRIKLLRECHHLSVSQISTIFGKSRTTFSQIELGNMKLPQDFLIEIANFFAVSLDWLTGRTDEPYSLSVIQNQEASLFKLSQQISLSRNQNLIYYLAITFICDLDTYYRNANKYSIDQRADVIYALNFWKYAANKLYEDGYNSQKESIQEVLSEILHISDAPNDSIFRNDYVDKMIYFFSGKYPSKRAGSSFAIICYDCIDVLKNIHVNDINREVHYNIRVPSTK